MSKRPRTSSLERARGLRDEIRTIQGNAQAALVSNPDDDVLLSIVGVLSTVIAGIDARWPSLNERVDA